ncbi:hypothetical protein V2J09_013426 [Rumex salicifolius]
MAFNGIENLQIESIDRILFSSDSPHFLTEFSITVTVELGKQSLCVIQLTNKTENFVGFKVEFFCLNSSFHCEFIYQSSQHFYIKTTSPKKYVVKPNIGVIKAKGAAEFTVIMIAQSVAPPDLLCKDKFLIQTTIVPFGLTEENITSETFVKDPSKHIEEKKLKVILVAPTSITADSPVSLKSSNGAPKQELLSEASLQKNEAHAETEKPTLHKDEERIQVAKATNEIRFAKEAESQPTEDADKLRIARTVDSNEVHKTSPAEYTDELRISRSVESSEIQQLDEQKVSSAASDFRSLKDIENLKHKLNDLGSKLALTEQTAAQLTEERNRIWHEKEIVEKELALAKRKNVVKEVHEGYPLLYVYMVALFSLTFGYLLGL